MLTVTKNAISSMSGNVRFSDRKVSITVRIANQKNAKTGNRIRYFPTYRMKWRKSRIRRNLDSSYLDRSNSNISLVATNR